MKKSAILLLLGTAALIYSCKKEQDVQSNGGTVYLDIPASGTEYFGSGSTEQNQKATLGRVLFYDRNLSVNNSVACASCHKQEFGFADNVALSRGFENRITRRNSMPIQNLSSAIFGGPFTGSPGSFFWDGRETNLQNLVARPITNHVEMGIDDLSVIPGKLAKHQHYRDLFKKAFGDEEVTMDRVAEAMSLFMNAITAFNTPFDQRMNGFYSFSALELEGERLFNTKYECNGCHRLFIGGYSSSEFMNIGLEDRGDQGAGEINSDPVMRGKFKIPNLRNVARTAPYMHDGRFATLNDVLDHYSHGIQNPQNLDIRLRDETGAPLRMNIPESERQALIAFLNTLTDNRLLTDDRFSNPFRVK